MRFHLFIITSNDEENFAEENLISIIFWLCVILVQYHFGPKLTLLLSIINNGEIRANVKYLLRFWTKIKCLHILDQSDIGPN
jgi:hypothetical protein